jgi:hypothetical protein
MPEIRELPLPSSAVAIMRERPQSGCSVVGEI